MKTYQCEVITPMFAHGENPNIFELRASEIKGLMRFWFRTALSSKLKNNIKALKAVESYIFGDTSRKSRILISVDERLSVDNRELSGTKFKTAGCIVDPVKYITFGMGTNKKKPTWSEYADNGFFKMNISFFSKKSEEIKALEFLVDNVLNLFSFFGGIGAKSDKGLGSFSIKDFPFQSNKDIHSLVNETVENIFSVSKKLFEKMIEENERNEEKRYKSLNFEPIEFVTPLPSYPLLNPNEKESFGVIPLNTSNCEEALSKIGKKYYEFRRELEKDGEFKNNLHNPRYEVKRAMLGLPIIYHEIAVTLNNEEKEKKDSDLNIGRKASPLKMSVKKENGKYYLAYVFLPAMIGRENKLVAKDERDHKTTLKASTNFKELYENFRDVWGLNK